MCDEDHGRLECVAGRLDDGLADFAVGSGPFANDDADVLDAVGETGGAVEVEEFVALNVPNGVDVALAFQVLKSAFVEGAAILQETDDLGLAFARATVVIRFL